MHCIDGFQMKKNSTSATRSNIFTGRNEVLAKVIFLHVSVILLTRGGGCSRFCSNFGGGSSKFSEGGYFFGGGGGSSKFFWEGGIFLGGFLQIFGGVFFWGGFLQIFGGGGGVSPPEYGHRSAGTHPTGMHSCCPSVRRIRN